MVFRMADGTSDAFYSKLSSPNQTSLIIGGSRAAQGIQPHIVDSVYGFNKIYNYAFTIAQTPFGEPYYNSISKKLDRKATKGVFIIDVSPWTLSELKTSNMINGYREDNTFIANTHFVNLKPNIEYLLESFNEKNEAILRNKNRKGLYQTFYVHDDGWLEVTIESDMISEELRTKNKISSYSKRLPNYKGFSQYRADYLIKTIELLKQYGDVYLVRIPVIEGMLAIENELVYDFDSRMNALASDHQIPYINMMPYNKAYNYTDGQHLTVISGRQFSSDLAHQMDRLRKQPVLK